LLHQVKKDLQNLWPDVDATLKIVEDLKVRKSYDKKLFKLGDLNENSLAISAQNFIKNYSWGDKIMTYVTIGEEKVNFYFAIQSNNVLNIG